MKSDFKRKFISGFIEFTTFFRLVSVRRVIFTTFFVLAVAFGLFYYNRTKLMKKVNPPVITFSDKYKTNVSVKVTNTELLNGVMATDVEDGDISLDIIVEGGSNMVLENEDGTKIKGVERDVTYAVCDSDNNVTKATQRIRYTDYKPPVIAPLEKVPTIKEKRYSSVIACFKATDVIDGDISEMLKIESLDSSTDNIRRGVFPVVLSVTNSCGDKVYYNTVVTLIE